MALWLARKTVEESPKVGEYWNTLGMAYYRTGNWQAAVEALEKSTKLRPDGIASRWFCMSMAHSKRGEKDQARDCYDRAVDTVGKNNSQDHELRRLRAEAAALLGLTEHPLPTNGKKEEHSASSLNR
jgi:uncharacterized protein HemY